MNNLKEKAINGAFWSLIERFGNQGILFFIGLILARILLPAEFGLIGMLMIFISISQSFVDSGFSFALIRKQDATTVDYSTIFWFNIIVSLLFYLFIYVSAPYIAQFYNEPLLTILARVLGLNIIINAFGTVQKTILTKKLDFKTQAKITIISIILGGIIGILTAWYGYGVWALVAQTISRSLLINFLFWFKSRWRPILAFSWSSFKEMFNFGSKLLLSGLILTISDNLYTLIIGKIYSAESLGYYTRANQFQKLPVTSIYGAINVATFPVLSELQNDDTKLKNAYRSLIKHVVFFLFPVMIVLAMVAEPMIHVILTDKWLPAAPMLQILCIVGAFYPIHAINLNILKVKGRSDLFLRLEIIKQILNVVTVIICYRLGVIALLWGIVMLNVVCYFLNSLYSQKILKYGMWEQINDVRRTFFSSVFVLSILLFFNYYVSNLYVKLVFVPIVGFTSYFLISKLLNREQLIKAQDIFLSLKKKFRWDLIKKRKPI